MDEVVTLFIGPESDGGDGRRSADEVRFNVISFDIESGRGVDEALS
jgi:hypothetical protein